MYHERGTVLVAKNWVNYKLENKNINVYKGNEKLLTIGEDILALYGNVDDFCNIIARLSKIYVNLNKRYLPKYLIVLYQQLREELVSLLIDRELYNVDFFSLTLSEINYRIFGNLSEKYLKFENLVEKTMYKDIEMEEWEKFIEEYIDDRI
jgi:hypothetical protein